MNRKKSIKEHYNSIAVSYNTSGEFSPISHILDTREKRVSKLLPDYNGRKILSAGCGPAPMASYITKGTGIYFGLDFSLQMLLEAQNRLKGQELRLSEGDILELPFQNESFDILLCLGALEYVNDVQKAIAEFSRVIMDDGSIILSMQNKNSLYRLWEHQVYYGQLYNSLKQHKRHPNISKPLEKLTSLNDIISMLNSSSLEVTDLIFYNFNFLPRPLDERFPKLSVSISRKFEFLYKSRLGILAADFIIKAKKIVAK